MHSACTEHAATTVGGVELQSGFSEYALLKHIKNVLMGESACPVSGHPEFIDRKSDKFSYHTGEAVGALEAVGEYRVENWLGFLGALPTRSSSIPSSARAAAPACRRAEALEVRYPAVAGVGEEAHSRQRHWCPWSKLVNVETWGHVADLIVMGHALEELRYGIVARARDNRFRSGRNFNHTTL